MAAMKSIGELKVRLELYRQMFPQFAKDFDEARPAMNAMSREDLMTFYENAYFELQHKRLIRTQAIQLLMSQVD
jgi:hypothetical protein